MEEKKSYLEMSIEPDPTILARQQLLASFKDREYRHAFLKEHVRTAIALQIRALRDRQGMTQEALGNALGMAQSWISQLENPDYGKMSVATLLRTAEAFDVSLDIRFEPFSRLLARLPRTSRDYFEVPNFSEEGLMERTDIEVQPAHARIAIILSELRLAMNQKMLENTAKSPASMNQFVSAGVGPGLGKILEWNRQQPVGRITANVGLSPAGFMHSPLTAIGR